MNPKQNDGQTQPSPTAPRVYRDRQALGSKWQSIRAKYRQVVFTNGCFDILHAGHVTYLEEAKALGDFLILGLNGDASIRRLKGPKRPIVPFAERACVLAGLRAIDLVVGFDEDTPAQLVAFIQPQVLVKGGDWHPDQIAGAESVLATGGEVRSLSFVAGNSTTDIIQTILQRHGLDTD